MVVSKRRPGSTSIVRSGCDEKCALPSGVGNLPSRGGFGRARSCILLFMRGGPGQHDTWDLKPSYEAHPERLMLLEVPEVGHTVTDRMWGEGIKWLVRYLMDQPIGRSP